MRHAWILAVVLAACGKGDHATCEKACRNYATLAYWAKWDPKINAEPAEQRDKLRRDKLTELDFIISRGIDQCVTNCQGANYGSQYRCMAKATTWPEVHACGVTEEEGN